MGNIKIVKFKEDRFAIADKKTGKVLDSAQGYGFKTKTKALAYWYWKNRSPEIVKREEKVKKWLEENKKFCDAFDQYSIEISKGSWGPDDKIDEDLVLFTLVQLGIKCEFTPKEIFKCLKT